MIEYELLFGAGLSFVQRLLFSVCVCFVASPIMADHVRDIQKKADEEKKADWGHWGTKPDDYTHWDSHSNRLIPIYTFGIDLNEFTGRNSAYRNAAKLKALYGRVPPGSLNPSASYMDQTDVYRLQKQALISGKKYIILIIFDGMDWQTTQAAAIYKTQSISYESGRGNGLYFQDYRGIDTDFGFFASSPHNDGTKFDVDSQTLKNPGGDTRGGYSAKLGGASPWARPNSVDYLIGKQRDYPDVVTDSAASATSMTSGIKTYNAAINFDPLGKKVVPLARELQNRGFGVGVVTSVTISHATPACAYANNVSRDDYQDLSRDLLGLPSVANRDPLIGVDVLLGGGWGEIDEDETDAKKDKSDDRDKDKDDDKDKAENDKEDKTKDPPKGGANYVFGNKILTAADIAAVDINNGGKYVVAQRTPGKNGAEVLLAAAREAHEKRARLLGFFGADGGNLPFQTADGQFDPYKKKYTEADVNENPTLADYTRAALGMLSSNKDGFWLMIEAGDVDWANHSNNIDDSIGAVLSGDDAFRMVTKWVEKNNAWKDTVVIVTADHGHYFNLLKPEVLIKND
jgi:alkaline phosphatase